MSRTKKTGGGKPSPFHKTITFSGATGNFSYYDNKAKEKKDLGDKISFILLDARTSITGFNEESGGGISSNYVENTGKEKLTVNVYGNGGKRVLAEGYYSEIKEKLQGTGAKFTRNLFALMEFNGEYEQVKIEVSGIMLSAWIEFEGKEGGKVYDYIITFKKGKLSKRAKGKAIPVTAKEEKELDAKLRKNPRAPRPVWFYILEIEKEDLPKEQVEIAEKEDEILQEYFESYKTPAETPVKKEDSEQEEYEDDLPF